MKDMHKLHYFLGIEVIRTSDGIMLSLLFKFAMTDHKPISTLLDRMMKLHANFDTPCEPTQYRQNIESLIYLTIMRPDLSYLFGLLNQFMKTP